MKDHLAKGTFRKVLYQADATLFDLEKPLNKALSLISTKYWKVTVLDHTRPSGAKGKLIRIESTNPVRNRKWYVAEVTPRPRVKRDENED